MSNNKLRDSNSLDTRQPHEPRGQQPAPEADGWRYVETSATAEIVIGNLTLRPHWTGLADGNEIRVTMKQIVTDHARAALVPGLVSTLRHLVFEELAREREDLQGAINAALAAARKAGVE